MSQWTMCPASLVYVEPSLSYEERKRKFGVDLINMYRLKMTANRLETPSYDTMEFKSNKIMYSQDKKRSEWRKIRKNERERERQRQRQIQTDRQTEKTDRVRQT